MLILQGGETVDLGKLYIKKILSGIMHACSAQLSNVAENESSANGHVQQTRGVELLIFESIIIAWPLVGIHWWAQLKLKCSVGLIRLMTLSPYNALLSEMNNSEPFWQWSNVLSNGLKMQISREYITCTVLFFN